MKYRSESLTKVAVPLKALISRFALMFLIFFAVAIMFLGKAETIAIERLRSGVVDVIAPLMRAMSQPIATVSSGIESLERFFSVYEENARLIEQNTRLLEWQSTALALAAENTTFREMLNFVHESESVFTAARVIGDSRGVFVRSILINGGQSSGIRKGHAVVNGSGLVGRVAETGRTSGRVLLITDLNSRIPVVSETTRVRAILAGDNGKIPKLAFLPPNARLEAGERIVTSGHGGVFPSNLPVGRILPVGDGVIEVKPFADLDRLEFVRIITNFPGNTVGELKRSNARLTKVK